jgi:hypothetical protein
MIASVAAALPQISSVISQLVHAAQQTVLDSHLIEYAPLGARYAGSDASGRCARCVLVVCSERGRSERAPALSEHGVNYATSTI